MPTAASPLRAIRTLALALMGAPVFIGIALFFTVGSSHTRTRNGHVVHTHAPAGWVYLGIVVLGVIAAAIVPLGGYRVPAVMPDQDPASVRTVALQAYQQSMLVRFAISESVAIISIALTFSSRSNTILPYVVGAVISELLLAYHVWPSESLISRVQRKLDRNGGRSDLANVLAGTV